jgi:biotin operon repressor
MTQGSGRFAITSARAVEDHRLGDAACRLLACLGTYSDRDGWCWPSTTTLAARLGVTRQAVQQRIQQLRQCGYIEVQQQHRADGGFHCNKYRLLFDRALLLVQEAASPSLPMQDELAPPRKHTLQGMQGRFPYNQTEPIDYKPQRTHKNDTLAKANAGSAPAALRARLYDAGKTILGLKTGGLVTRLLNHCAGDCQRALDLLQLCGAKSDPREYLNAILRGDATIRADDVLAETDRLYREIGVSA